MWIGIVQSMPCKKFRSAPGVRMKLCPGTVTVAIISGSPFRSPLTRQNVLKEMLFVLGWASILPVAGEEGRVSTGAVAASSGSAISKSLIALSTL